MKLKLGKMTNTELAQWFNIGESTYRRQKEERLKILATYCKFHLEGETKKKIYIDEIYETEYRGDKLKAKEKAIELTMNNWAENGYDTIKNVTQKNLQTYKQKQYKLKETTVRNYTYYALKEAVNYSRARYGVGKLGCYCKEWGALENGKYRPLTAKEKEIKIKITKAFYNQKENKDDVMIASIIELGIDEGLSVDEINQQIGLWKRLRYEEWKTIVENKLGFEIKLIVKIEWTAY